jgi:hypothetical protein
MMPTAIAANAQNPIATARKNPIAEIEPIDGY